MADDTQQSVWNFDGAELFLIFQVKSAIFTSLKAWDLEESYSNIRLLRMELDAKLKRGNKKMVDDFDKEQQLQKNGKYKKKLTEKENVDKLIKDLDEAYSGYMKLNSPSNKEKSVMYQALEFVYMELSHLMKKHGLYFREGEDMSLAVLRR